MVPVSEDLNAAFGAPDHVNAAAKLYTLAWDTDSCAADEMKTLLGPAERVATGKSAADGMALRRSRSGVHEVAGIGGQGTEFGEKPFDVRLEMRGRDFF